MPCTSVSTYHRARDRQRALAPLSQIVRLVASAALGDAVYVASARLQYGLTNINSITCLDGDFDGDGSFTLNDAARVAEAQFGLALLPWDSGSRRLVDSRLITPPIKPASLSTRTFSALKKRAVRSVPQEAFATIKPASLQADVHVSSARTAGPLDLLDAFSEAEGRWKALSVQFAGAKIASVQMHQGIGGQITTQHADGFFQAAELQGGGLDWPNGLAATVTFEAGSDMDAVRVDFASRNTYVVQYEDPLCVPSKSTPCRTAVHFGGVA